MNNIVYHRHFLTVNKLQVAQINDQQIRNQITSYNKIKEHLDKNDLDEKVKEEFEKELQKLDFSIVSQLEEEFEEQLPQLKEPEISKPYLKVTVNNLKSPDERILDAFYKTGNHVLLISELQEKGFKTKIVGQNTMVGRYKLERSSLFQFKYFLSKLK